LLLGRPQTLLVAPLQVGSDLVVRSDAPSIVEVLRLYTLVVGACSLGFLTGAFGGGELELVLLLVGRLALLLEGALLKPTRIYLLTKLLSRVYVLI